MQAMAHGIFTGFQNPATVMTGHMDGIPNGLGSAMSAQKKITIIS
jgi:hypothetical protein